MARLNYINPICTITLTIFLAISIFLSGGCGSEPVLTDSALDNEFLMDSVTDPDTIEVMTGGKFSISLPSDPTTDHSWKSEFDSRFLELIEVKYEPSSDQAGTGGMETFDFLMLKQGEVKVKITNNCPLEEDGMPSEHVTLIRIHG